MKAWVIPGEGVVDEEPSYTPDHGARLDAETLLATLPQRQRTLMGALYLDGKDLKIAGRLIGVGKQRAWIIAGQGLHRLRREAGA